MNAAAQPEYAIVVAAHGSRDPASLRECESLVQLIKDRAIGHPVAHGYPEFAAPTIDEAVRTVVAAGARRVVLLPALLFAAMHAKNDMPAELAWIQQAFPGVEFHFGASLDLHPYLLRLAQQRIVAAEGRSGRTVKRSGTCLVVVGRGTSDPDANSEVSKLARMLEEGMGFGASFVCYSGTAAPNVTEGLRTAARLGFERMIVFPYFLFDGRLIKRIYAAADALGERLPEVEVIKADYLGAHTDIADVLLERAQHSLVGRAHMNCSLCKYRIQIVGFEEQVGEPQRAHHLRARGPQGQAVAPEAPAPAPSWNAYTPHPIEAESFQIIERGRDWSSWPVAERRVLQRLVHTSGDFGVVDDIYFSPGAVDIGMRALLRCQRVVTDVTMVQSGLKRSLLQQLGIEVWCGVHDRESHLLSQAKGLTRSAAGIQRAWERWGNDVVIAIGDAPTAISETTRLIREQGWRPQLVIGVPVGFVGTRECKEDLRRCIQVPRMTNSGTRGGSPWAAAIVNALMINGLEYLAQGPPS